MSLFFSESCKKGSDPQNVVTENSLDTGLLAHYPFNGNALDVSGNSYNLTVSGPLATSDRFGNAASAYTFNGKSDYMIIPNLLKADSIRQFSISIWIKPSDITYNSVLSLLSVISNSCSSSFSISHENSTFILRDKNLTQDSPTFCFAVVTSGSLPDPTGTWHHLVLVQTYINGPNEINPRYDYDQYYDGAKLSHGSSGLGLSPKAVSFVRGGIVGGNNNSGNYAANFEMFSGAIDDLRIYNRAVSSAEVSRLFNLKN